MKRTFILVLALLVAFAGIDAFAGGGAEKKAESKAAPAAPAQPAAAAGPAKVLKISNGVNDKHPFFLACLEFEKIVESRLPGKYDVQAYHSAQLGDDVRATEAVRMGTLEMVATSASPITGLVPEFSVFDLPFIVPSHKAADVIYDGPVGAKLAGLLEPKGIKLLAYWENGFRQLTNSRREVKSPEDLKGLKVRTMQNPIHLDAWKALGANPTPMPFSELFTAMQQRTIDGQENPIPTIYLSKFFEVQKYVTLSGHVYGPIIVLINKKLFDSFPAEDQKVIQEAAQAAAVYERRINREMEKSHIEELRKAGMTVTVLTPEQAKAFQDACAPVYAAWEPKIGKALVDEFRAAVKDVK